MSPQQSRAALAAVTSEAVAIAGEIYDGLPSALSAEARRAVLLETIPPLIDVYGSGAGALAADFYSDTRAAAGAAGKYTSTLVFPDRAEKIDRAIAWSASPLFDPDADPAAAGNIVKSRLAEVVQPEVASPYRATILENRKLDPASAGWRRVSGGGCSFCRMLAARGAVYKQSSARFASHPACSCSAEPVFEGQAIGPEASPMQYMASQRSRTPAQKAELRSYLDSHYPAPAKPATAAPTAKAPAPAKPAAPAKPKVIPPSTTVDEFNSRKPFPDADVSDLPSSALFSKKGPEHARESERNDYDMAARRYAFRGYERWNGALRGTRDTTEAGWADINRMRQITAETTTKDVTLHRALADLDFAGDGALIGKSFTDKGFMSTAYGGASRMTLEEAADYPIRLEIVAPAGTRGSLIGNTEEREFVLAPGTTLTIIDAVEAGGVKYVRAVVTSQGE